MYSPVFELYMARCERNLSRLREAAHRLEAMLARPVTDNPPLAWSNAVRDARAELEALRTSIPSIRISGADVASATVDGTPAELERLIAVNPGRHIVRALARDGRITTQYVSLAAGDQGVVVALVFAPLPKLVSPSASRTGEQRMTRRDPWKTSAWITGGAALACAILGTVTGLIAQSRMASIRSECQGSQCPPSLEEEAERARSLANMSTAAFGVAAIDATFSLGFALIPPWLDAPASAKPRQR
jgi:hypothetical protein